MGHFLYLVVGFIITVGISFGYGWKLTLAVSCYIPLVIAVNYYVGKVSSEDFGQLQFYSFTSA